MLLVGKCARSPSLAITYSTTEHREQGVTKRCCLSRLTSSVIVYEPKYGGRGGITGCGPCGVSANEYSCAYVVYINFRDLAPYLTYDREETRASPTFSMSQGHIIGAQLLQLILFC